MWQNCCSVAVMPYHLRILDINHTQDLFIAKMQNCFYRVLKDDSATYSEKISLSFKVHCATCETT